MRAYILCGGQGTRLRTVTGDGQKVLVSVNGRPFLALILDQLKCAGISQVTLCAGYRADLMGQALTNLSDACNLPLQLITEHMPLGTGGAILNALQQQPPTDRYLVLNADTFLDCSAYCKLREASGNTVLAVQVAQRERFGSIACTADGQVSALEEKTQSGPGLINGGAYAFLPDALSGFHNAPCSMERQILPILIERGLLYAVTYRGAFHDIGTPESLSAFKAQAQNAAHIGNGAADSA